jgi:hypothetical protein
VFEVNAGADARAFATLRRDMAIAIARAEQHAFDRLLRGVASDIPAAAAAVVSRVQGALTRSSGRELPLPPPFKLHIEPVSRPDRKTVPTRASVHRRRRNDLAAILLATGQRREHLTDPAAAAGWLVSSRGAAAASEKTGMGVENRKRATI